MWGRRGSRWQLRAGSLCLPKLMEEIPSLDLLGDTEPWTASAAKFSQNPSGTAVTDRKPSILRRTPRRSHPLLPNPSTGGSPTFSNPPTRTTLLNRHTPSAPTNRLSFFCQDSWRTGGPDSRMVPPRPRHRRFPPLLGASEQQCRRRTSSYCLRQRTWSSLLTEGRFLPRRAQCQIIRSCRLQGASWSRPTGGRCRHPLVPSIRSRQRRSVMGG